MTTLSNTGFIWIDTIVNLYGVQGSDQSRAAIVGGYNWVGDGGGGVFFWDPSTTAGENYGTIIVPTSSPGGRWLRIYSGPLDVRYFGAKGQGNPPRLIRSTSIWPLRRPSPWAAARSTCHPART